MGKSVSLIEWVVFLAILIVIVSYLPHEWLVIAREWLFGVVKHYWPYVNERLHL